MAWLDAGAGDVELRETAGVRLLFLRAGDAERAASGSGATSEYPTYDLKGSKTHRNSPKTCAVCF